MWRSRTLGIVVSTVASACHASPRAPSCPAGDELVMLHRSCPPSKVPILAPRGTPSCAFPGAMVCGVSLDDGPDGSIFTCQRDGAVRSFELRAPSVRVVGGCADNLADGDWRTYEGGELRRVVQYRRGAQIGVSTP